MVFGLALLIACSQWSDGCFWVSRLPFCNPEKRKN